MKIVRENINEKFSDVSDPIKDLEIGQHAIWKKADKELFGHENRSSKNMYLTFFKEYCPDIFNEHAYIWVVRTILHTVHRVVHNNLSPEQAYLQVRKEEFWHDRDIPLQWKKIVQSKILEILEKKYQMVIDLENKSISEKFQDDSDPIKDMGIGARFAYNKLSAGDILRFVKDLQIQGGGKDNPLYKEGNLLLITRIDNEHLDDCDKAVYGKVYETMEDIRLKKKPIYEINEWYWSYPFFAEFFEKYAKIRTFESISERFEDQSDPVKDMRIGQSRYKHLILDLIPKKAPILYGQYHDVANFLRTMIEDDRISVRINIFKADQDKTNMLYIFGGPVWLKAFAGDLKTCAALYIKSIRDVQYSSEDNTVTVIFDHSLKESVNEKFKEESDPIEDMGIGTYAMYKNLKRGDVLKVIKYLRMSNKGYTYPEGSLITVNCKPEWWNECKRFTHTHYRNTQDLKNDKPASWEKNNVEWNISYEFFQEYFTRIGNTKINEKFEEESDPIGDLGIGVRNLIKNSVEKIFRLDNKIVEKGECFIYDDKKKLQGTMIKEISIREDVYFFNLYSDNFLSAPHVVIDKFEYCKNIIKEMGMESLFDKITKHPESEPKTVWGVAFHYKEDTAQYFQDYIGTKHNAFQ